MSYSPLIVRGFLHNTNTKNKDQKGRKRSQNENPLFYTISHMIIGTYSGPVRAISIGGV